MNITKAIARVLMAALMIGAGTMHFVTPGFFLKITPPYVPYPAAMVLLSGACEILLGLLLFVPRVSPYAAWGIIALLIAVFPANIYVYQHQELVPASPTAHLLRMLLQGVFIAWAYWLSKVKRPADGS